jgi:hypothetical protein
LFLRVQIHTNAQLLADNSGRQVELRTKEDEISSLKAEIGKVVKVREPLCQ